MFKTTFTSKDLARCLDISSREQVYWYDNNYLVADIQNERPRIYSVTQATCAGLIRFFLDHGVGLEKAARIARIATTIMFDAQRRIETVKSKGRFVGHLEKMVIQNSLYGKMEISGASSTSTIAEDESIHMQFHDEDGYSLSYIFLTTDKPSFEDSMYMNIGAMQRGLEVETTYYIGRVVRRIWDTLKINPLKVSDAPMDERVVLKPSQGDEKNIVVGLVGDSCLE